MGKSLCGEIREGRHKSVVKEHKKDLGIKPTLIKKMLVVLPFEFLIFKRLNSPQYISGFNYSCEFTTFPSDNIEPTV